MKCLQCGYTNKPDADACNLCGTLLRNKKVKKPNAAGATVEMRAPGIEETPLQAVALPLPPPSTPSLASVTGHRLEAAGSAPLALVPGREVTIGRQPGCSFTIPSTRISRLHAVIRWDGDKPVLVDKGSSNGTFVRGKRIKEHVLQDGDEIEIGPFLCVYRSGEAKAPAPDDVGDRTQTIAGGGDLFTGQIADGVLAEVLSGLEFNKKTGTLDVFGKEGDGYVCLERGVPLTAKANGREDDEAILSLLAMRSGRYSFTPELEAKERRCKATITALLLEAGRRADELSKKMTQPD